VGRSQITHQGLTLAPPWQSYIEEWDRSLRATNHPQTTRYNYRLAVTQLASFSQDRVLRLHDRRSREHGRPQPDEGAENPVNVRRCHIEWFIAWIIETRSASTALNKYKCLQQFFRYLVSEQEIPTTPWRTCPNRPPPRSSSPRPRP